MTESMWRLWLDARRAAREGLAGFDRRQRDRLADLVAYARAHSPYYRELYRELPAWVTDPALLPVTDKGKLTDRFDDWATDRAVTAERVRSFVDNPELVGRPFLGRYLVATTSGTSGRRGMFVHDDRQHNVETAVGSRAPASVLTAGGLLHLVLRGGRFASLVATGGHFMGYAGYVRATAESRWRRKFLRVFSVHTPLARLVEELNRYRPAVIAGYTSAIKLLAGEQQAGRLRIDPVLVLAGGETITSADLDRMAAAFHAPVRAGYGGTECTFLSYGCAYGWYHVNSDWAIAEPVDADYRPTPPGEWSHTVLISDLANRVQPILRYDMGDRVLTKPEPCPCGNPLPALRVQGRSGDTLTVPTEHGEDLTLTPLALATLFDRTPGIELAQVVQTKPATLRVRLRPAADADPDHVWRQVHDELSRLLTSNNLDNIIIERAEEPPELAPGGKIRAVIPLHET
jgi:phenylacetate-coenzyme A ligase PaaK-like adenylate-forming protein